MIKLLSCLLLLGTSLMLSAADAPKKLGPSGGQKPEAGCQIDPLKTVDGFDAQADKALLAMRAKAEELKIGGVAVIAYFDGSEFRSWTSKASMVNRYKDAPSATSAGANLLSVAYAKATEMADTLKDSGCAERPKMAGELGWKGGVVRAWNKGYLIAAFSGAKSEEDVEVSKAGIAALAE
jgi:uncharacterized protein GlcG (DUF336 family)